MIIEGKFSVKAPIQKLWDTLFGDVKGVGQHACPACKASTWWTTRPLT